MEDPDLESEWRACREECHAPALEAECGERITDPRLNADSLPASGVSVLAKCPRAGSTLVLRKTQ